MGNGFGDEQYFGYEKKGSTRRVLAQTSRRIAPTKEISVGHLAAGKSLAVPTWGTRNECGMIWKRKKRHKPSKFQRLPVATPFAVRSLICNAPQGQFLAKAPDTDFPQIPAICPVHSLSTKLTFSEI